MKKKKMTAIWGVFDKEKKPKIHAHHKREKNQATKNQIAPKKKQQNKTKNKQGYRGQGKRTTQGENTW